MTRQSSTVIGPWMVAHSLAIADDRFGSLLQDAPLPVRTLHQAAEDLLESEPVIPGFMFFSSLDAWFGPGFPTPPDEHSYSLVAQCGASTINLDRHGFHLARPEQSPVTIQGIHARDGDLNILTDTAEVLPAPADDCELLLQALLGPSSSASAVATGFEFTTQRALLRLSQATRNPGEPIRAARIAVAAL